MKIKILERKNDTGLLILRLAVGTMMFLHGVGKLLHGLAGIQAMLRANGMPVFLSYGVLVGEVVAPLLIVVGFRTRVSAAIVVCNCLVAWYLAHRNAIFSLNLQGGWVLELLGLFFFGSLTLFFTGGGRYAMSKKSMWD